MNSASDRITPAQALRRLTLAIETAINNPNPSNVLPAQGVINGLHVLAEAMQQQEEVIAALQKALQAKP
jgi:phage tail sheath gpL-like